MTETSSTPEVQAAADLSPLSPSPVHTAVAPVDLPALQDTADLLDTMTEMPFLQYEGHAAVRRVDSAPHSDSEPLPVAPPSAGPVVGDHADADSLDEAYGEGQEEQNQDKAGSEAQNIQKTQDQPQEPDADDDDYLKSFDSPAQDAQDDTPQLQESNPAQVPPSPSANTHVVVESSSLVAPGTPAASVQPIAQPIAQPTAQPTASVQPTSVPAVDVPQPGITDPTQAQPTTSSGQPSQSSVSSRDVDIQRLVAEMTGQPTEPQTTKHEAAPAVPSRETQTLTTASSSSSLPPKPPAPLNAQAEQKHSLQQYHSIPSAVNVPPSFPSGAAQPAVFAAARAAPGTSSNPPNPAPSAAVSSYSSLPVSAPSHPHPANLASYPHNDTESLWQLFIEDERRYMTEAKWDKFPEGTRIFIGNLSSERVSKRDVFDAFHRFGRLAQISLKSAYGFVQYHDLEDAQAAMRNMQGAEVKGRKIHLEVSRVQKKTKGDDRAPAPAYSPDRAARNGRQVDRDDRFDGAQSRRSRQDFRYEPGGYSPQRPSRGNGYARGRELGYQQNNDDNHSHSRGRSRSPPPYGRPKDSYRHRSRSRTLSPHFSRGGPTAEERLPIPRRTGTHVPDVQCLLLQEIPRDFIVWVERAFVELGLKVNVMFLNPTFSREAVVQRQAVEGVHAIVDLDMIAHSRGKIAMRVFDRSSGAATSARYDDYLDLDPSIAAQLIVRAKSQAAPQHGQYHSSHHAHQPPRQPQATAAAYPATAYGQAYPPHPQQAPPQALAPTPAPAPAHAPPAFNTHSQSLPSAPPAGNNAEIERALKQFGNLDHATVQQVMSSLQGASQPSAYGAAPPQAGYTTPLNGPGDYYQAHPASNRPPPPMGNSAAEVNDIMAQLARFRQP